LRWRNHGSRHNDVFPCIMDSNRYNTNRLAVGPSYNIWIRLCNYVTIWVGRLLHTETSSPGTTTKQGTNRLTDENLWYKTNTVSMSESLKSAFGRDR